MTVREEALEVLKKKAAQMFGIDEATLGYDTRFVEDLNCKSVNLVQLSAALEDEFDLEVSFSNMKKFVTFGDACDFIDEALSC